MDPATYQSDPEVLIELVDPINLLTDVNQTCICNALQFDLVLMIDLCIPRMWERRSKVVEGPCLKILGGEGPQVQSSLTECEFETSS